MFAQPILCPSCGKQFPMPDRGDPIARDLSKPDDPKQETAVFAFVVCPHCKGSRRVRLRQPPPGKDYYRW